MSIEVKHFLLPPVDIAEVLRYARAPGERSLQPTIRALVAECTDRISARVCWTTESVSICDDRCTFSSFSVRSSNLANHLQGCDRSVLFAASIGSEIDRMIAKYSRISPMKALLLQALGTERVEALCDVFCDTLARTFPNGCRTRFSPGYGDLPLSVQCNFFELLACERHIGVWLSDAMLMTPTKSVTAFVGIPSDGE